MKPLFLFCVIFTSFIPDNIFGLVGSYAKTSMVSIAFDDGNTNQYINALPILDSIGYKATFYIITKTLNESNSARMNRGQVFQLYADGQEIGSHGRNHLDLAFCWPWTIKYEIEQSKKDLHNIGIDANSFAYPDGGSNFLARYYVRQAGYANGRGTPRDGYTGVNTDQYNLCCKYVVNTTTVNEIKNWVDESKRKGYWLILLFHAVNKSESNYQFSCTRKTFKEICLYLKSKNAAVLPVGQALKRYFPASQPKNLN